MFMKKVLVVEDNKINLELLLVMLSANGFDAHKAIDGKEALRKIKEEKFDLIFMDIELPGMDGVEVTREIKAKDKSIPVIAVTSYAMKGDRERFLAEGFNDYIAKPIDVHGFIQKLAFYKN